MDNNSNPVLILSSALEMILKITETVYIELENGFKLYDTFRKGKTPKTDGIFRDNLYMSAAITDNDLVAIFTSIIAGIATIQSCQISLGANGKLTMLAEQQNEGGIKKNEVKTPTIAAREAVSKIARVSEGVEVFQGLADIVISGINIRKSAESRNWNENFPAEVLSK